MLTAVSIRMHLRTLWTSRTHLLRPISWIVRTIGKAATGAPASGQIGYVNAVTLGSDSSTSTSFPSLLTTGSLAIGTYILQAYGICYTQAMVQSLEIGITTAATASWDEYSGYTKQSLNASAGTTIYVTTPSRIVSVSEATTYYVYCKSDANTQWKNGTRLTVLKIA